MTKTTSLRILLATVLTLLLAAGNLANAECKQKKMQGTWGAQIFAYDTTSNRGFWFSCKLKLNSKGKYNPDTSVCNGSAGTVLYVSGELKVNKNCSIKNSNINFWLTNGSYQGFSQLRSGAVDRGQTVLQSVGEPGSPNPIIFHAVKR